MKKFILSFVVLCMLVGLASAACVGTAPPAYTVVWNVSRNTNCSDMSIVQNVIYVNKNSTLRFVNVTLKFNGSCTVATSCPRLVDKGGLKVYNSTFTFAKGVSGGYTNAFHLIVLRNGSSATFSRVYLNRTGAFANNFNPDFWAIKAKDAKLSVNKVRFANGRGIYISGNSTSRSNITNVNFTNTSGAIFVNMSQRLIVSDIRVNRSYNYGIYVYGVDGFNISRISLSHVKTGFVLITVNNFNIDGYSTSNSQTSLNATHLSNFTLRNVYVKKVNYGLNLFASSKADIRNITVDRSNRTSFGIMSSDSFNITGVYVNMTLLEGGILVSDSTFGNISNCLIQHSNADGLYILLSSGGGIYHVNSSHNNDSGISFMNTNISGSTVEDVSANDNGDGVIARVFSSTFREVEAINNAGQDLIYDTKSNILRIFEPDNEYEKVDLLPIETIDSNLWAWGHPDTYAGMVGGTGPGWIKANPTVKLPSTPSFKVKILTANNIPDFTPVGSQDSEIACRNSNYDSEFLKPMCLATFGFNLYYAVRKNTPLTTYPHGAGPWMLVMHNILTDNKQIVDLSKHGIVDVFAVMNYKHSVLVFGRRTSNDPCKNGLAQVLLFEPGSSNGESPPVYEQCLTCESEGEFLVYDYYTKFEPGVCPPPGGGNTGYCYEVKKFAYDVNNASVSTQFNGFIQPGYDCRKPSTYLKPEDQPKNAITPNGIAIGPNDWIYLGIGQKPGEFTAALMVTSFSEDGVIHNMGYADIGGWSINSAGTTPFYYFQGSGNQRLDGATGVDYSGNWQSMAMSVSLSQVFRSATQVNGIQGATTAASTLGSVWNIYGGGKESFYLYGTSGLRWLSNGSVATDNKWPSTIGPSVSGAYAATAGGKMFYLKDNKITTYRTNIFAGNCAPGHTCEHPTMDSIPWYLDADTIVQTPGGVNLNFGSYAPGARPHGAHYNIYIGKGDAFMVENSDKLYYFPSLDGGTQKAMYGWLMPFATSGVRTDAVFLTGDQTAKWSGIILQGYENINEWMALAADNLPYCNFDDTLCGKPEENMGGLCNEYGSPADPDWIVHSTSRGANCRAKTDVGDVCVNNADCKTNFCSSGKCVLTHYCDMEAIAANNYCVLAHAEGSACSRDAECQSGNCINGTFLNYTGVTIGDRPNPFWGMAWTSGGTVYRYGICAPKGAQCYVKIVLPDPSLDKYFIHQPKRFTPGPLSPPAGLSMDINNGAHNSFSVTYDWFGVKYGASLGSPPVYGSSLDVVACPWDGAVYDENLDPGEINVNTKAFVQNQTFCDYNTFRCVNYDPSKNLNQYVVNGGDINPPFVKVAWDSSNNYLSYDLYIGTDRSADPSSYENYYGKLAWAPGVGSISTVLQPGCGIDISGKCVYDIVLNQPPLEDANVDRFYARLIGITSHRSKTSYLPLPSGKTVGWFYPFGSGGGDPNGPSSSDTQGSYLSDFIEFKKTDGKWGIVTTTTTTTTTTSISTTTTVTLPLPGSFYVVITDEDTGVGIAGVQVKAKWTVDNSVKAGSTDVNGKFPIIMQSCAGNWLLDATKDGYIPLVQESFALASGKKEAPFKMRKLTSATDVAMECHPMNGGTGDVDKSRIQCTFNNIPNLDGKNYAEMKIGVKTYGTSPSEVSTLEDYTFTLNGGSFEKEYSGKATINLFAGGSLCSPPPTVSYGVKQDILLSWLNRPIWAWSDSDVWYIPIDSMHTVVGCLDSFGYSRSVALDVTYQTPVMLGFIRLGTDISPRHAIGSAIVMDCYSDSDCISNSLGGTCVDNKCSNNPYFETPEYPKSIVNGNNRLAVSLKWKPPKIEGVSVYNYVITRGVISGIAGSAEKQIYSGSGLEFVDVFNDVTNQEDLIDKEVNYKVDASFTSGGSRLTKYSPVTSVVIQPCSTTVAWRMCTAGIGCDAGTGLCSAMTKEKCMFVSCIGDPDCTANGCDAEHYHCAVPAGGVLGDPKFCIPYKDTCVEWATTGPPPRTPISCVDASKFCGDIDNINFWIEQNVNPPLDTGTAFKGVAWRDTDSYCDSKKIVKTSKNWQSVSCNADGECGDGLSCEGEIYTIGNVEKTCTFNEEYNQAGNNIVSFAGVTLGYCYPDGFVHKVDGGYCRGTGPVGCTPGTEPNPDCESSHQYCDAISQQCAEKKSPGKSCVEDYECIFGVCSIDNPLLGTKVCKVPLTCDYDVCKDRPDKGFQCGCDIGYVCTPNDWGDKSTWKSGTCRLAVADNENCGSGALGIPDAYLYNKDAPGSYADWICASQNCLGDYYIYDNKLIGKCKPANVVCDANWVGGIPANAGTDPEVFCHCATPLNPNGDPPPCATIGGTVNRDMALGEIMKTNTWCYNKQLSVAASKPGSKAEPDFECYKRYATGSVCSENYQCVSTSCIDGVCAPSGEVDPDNPALPLGAKCILKDLMASSSAVWNSRSKNPETVNTQRWDDSCAEGLYCEPCDYLDSKLYDSKTILCSSATITHGATGRCQPVQAMGEWCYSTNQCNGEVTSVNNLFFRLKCGVDSTHSYACTSGNWYCKAGSTDSYNKICIQTAGSGCIQDSREPWGSITMFEDDTCYNLAKTGGASKDTFCDNNYKCTYGTSLKNCQDWSLDIRPKAIEVEGRCATNTCPVPADKVPYESNQCWRSMGYSSSTHNVAPATVQLVYCDGGGQCRWKKQAGVPCLYDAECSTQYCTSAKICGKQSCKVDADCKNPDTQRCVNGLCIPKTTDEFVVVADNGLSKPIGSPFPTQYDFVMNCGDRDTFITAVGKHTMSVKYVVMGGSGSSSGSEKYLGDSETVVSSSVKGDLYDDLCDTELQSNDKIKTTFNIAFYPVINGMKGIEVQKTILVLARPLSVKVTRCGPNIVNNYCPGTSRTAFVVESNNTVGVLLSDDERMIACDYAKGSGEPYVSAMYPRTDLTIFGNYPFAVAKDWNVEKYYKCIDQYGSVKFGTTLVNPAEYIFGLKFSRSQQIFVLLIMLLGIPVLVLVGSRLQKR